MFDFPSAAKGFQFTFEAKFPGGFKVSYSPTSSSLVIIHPSWDYELETQPWESDSDPEQYPYDNPNLELYEEYNWD